MKGTYIVLIALTLFCLSAGKTINKRALFDSFATWVATLAAEGLPEESVKAGCNAAGFYNQEKDGKPPMKDDKTGGLVDEAGKIITVPGGIAWPKGGAEAFCAQKGWYNKDKDANGNYKPW